MPGKNRQPRRVENRIANIYMTIYMIIEALKKMHFLSLTFQMKD